MAKSSYVQSSFTGGEWAAEVQGRAEENAYKTGMNKCLNYYPVVQGALTRRQGIQRLGYTRAGPARCVAFDVPANQVVLEFTNDGLAGLTDVGHIRFWQGTRYLTNEVRNVTSISTANPAVVTVSASETWSTGDNVFFSFNYGKAGDAAPNVAGLAFKAFPITVISGTTFSIPIDGSTLGWLGPSSPSANYTVSRIAELVSPYITATSSAFQGVNGEWEFCSFCQDESQLIITHPRFAPRTLQVTPGSGFGFTLNTLTLYDGPYLDINTTTTTLTPSAISGTITVTASATTGINGGQGFLSTDVGRHIRMWSAPAPWDRTSNAYVIGSVVLYTDGNAYVALKNDNGPASNNGVAAPPGNVDHWALIGNPSTWCWLIITVVTDTTHVTATIQQSTTTANNTMYNALATSIWQLGLYSDTTGYPTVGTFHENRLYLAGQTPNRVDGSMVGGSSLTNAYGTFSPTTDDGTVGDANAVAAIAKTNRNNTILWLSSDDQGLLIGFLTEEGKFKASNLDDPITPSSVQFRRLTNYGSAPGWPDPIPQPSTTIFGTYPSPDATIQTGQQAVSPAGYGVQPVLAGRMHLFVQRMQRKVIEMGHPTEAGTFYMPNTVTDLTLTAPHLTVTGVQEMAYVQNPKPVLWARRRDGALIGATYMRDRDNLIVGWHEHLLGKVSTQTVPRVVRSMCSAPSLDQTTDFLYVVTTDGTVAPPKYVTKAVHFDGLTHLLNSSCVATDSRYVAVFFWFRGWNSSTFNTVFALEPAGNYGVWAAINNDGGGSTPQYFESQLRAHSNVGNYHATSNKRAQDTSWHSVLFAADTVAGTGAIYIDDVLVTNNVNAPSSTTASFNGYPMYIGDDTFSDPINGDAAIVWCQLGMNLLSGGFIPEATRRKFTTAANKPMDPAGYPGGTPLLLLNGDASSFSTNQGSCGTFTVTGTLTNASTSPSD